MAAAFKYWAFISYSHQDRAWGNWLHRTLETYRVPSRLVGRQSCDGGIPARLFPVFRDRDELPSSADLGGVINEALAASRYQIVICSPRSAASKWVNEEVRHFKSLGREDRVLCLIVDGEPNSGDARECFAPALRFRVTSAGEITSAHAEPIAADAREHADGKAGAKLKLLAGLLGVGFDELVQRERQRQFWQRVQAAAATIAFVTIIGGISQWFLHQRASREREIKIEKIVESGRQELLEGHQARAAVFLNEAYKMGYDTVPLRFMLGQAMQPVEALTNVRVKHGGKEVYRAVFSPDDKRFALDVLADAMTQQQQASVKIYDAASGALVTELPEAPPLPIAMEFFDGGNRLLIAGYPDDDKTGNPVTRIWDLASPGPPLKLDGVGGTAGETLSRDGTRLLIAGKSGLELHDTRTGALIKTINAGKEVVAATYSPDGESIALADSTGHVEIHSADDARLLQHFSEPDAPSIAALQYVPDGKRLLSLSVTGDIRIWDIRQGVLRIAFAADPIAVNGVQFSADGRRLLTIGAEGYKVWSTARGILLFFTQQALDIYAAGALSPDGDTLFTADGRSSVSEAWDVPSRRKSFSLDNHTDGVRSVVFDSAGKTLLLVSRDGWADVWRMPVRPKWKYESYEAYPDVARFDRSGRRLLVGGGYDSGSVRIFDLDSGAVSEMSARHTRRIWDVRFSPNEDRILTASEDGDAGLWNARTASPIATLHHGGQGVFRAQFSRDDRRILTISNPFALDHADAAGLWDAHDGHPIARLEHSGIVHAASFNGASTQIVTAGRDGLVKIWNAADGGLLKSLEEHKAPVMSAKYSSDGQRVLTASLDNKVHIWNIDSGTVIRALDDAALGVPMDATFSPDESNIAISTQAGNVWLWFPESGHTLALKGHHQEVNGTLYSPDGSLLFSYSDDGAVLGWDAKTGVQLAVVGTHEAAVSSADLAADASQLVTDSWGQAEIWNVRNENRSATDIERTLDCNTVWVFDEASLDLRPVATARANCAFGGSESRGQQEGSAHR